MSEIDWSGPPNPSMPRISRENIAEVEEAVLSEANRAMSLLEGAIAAWDAAKDKPPELRQSIAGYRKFHEALADWARRMLQARKKASLETRIRLLGEFVAICRMYEGD